MAPACASGSGHRARPNVWLDACTRLREDTTLTDLPERFSLFGLTRLPASYLDVLGALATGRDVHLFLLHPSPALWEKLAGYRAPAGPPTCGGSRPPKRP